MNKIDYRGYQIMICTRSMNLQLYFKSMILLNIPCQKKRFCNTTAEGYIYELLKEDVDYVINIDEDAFVLDQKSLFSLLDYIIDNDYINCGMPDGGVLPIRTHNPLVTNPFFNIINIKRIKEKINIKDIENVQFNRYDYLDIFPKKLTGDYDFDNFEPYNRIFLWIALNFKTLYLDAITHKDQISTILLNQNREPILYHSWYSRFYNKDTYHTKRINDLFLECEMINGIKADRYIYFIIKQLFIEINRKSKRLYFRKMKLIKLN